ncbi:hypothetical protein P2H44_25400 [Albimonas sp. CAU 1670]|uniref:hypothetical protein n=1 Tax=Albimonas sp. CAU 1670 TaxID=3032599 RepID=UPI0023DBADD0|nr:hypothetical protein [Albimonas sp. CAU 1670]MDF2235900.1 hypothetical protein [Albimonas sp. CAU 1670]
MTQNEGGADAPLRSAEDTAAPETGGRTTLVMLSGGIDSVWTLMRLLRDTGDTVYAHHVHFLNEEGRHRVEAEACRAIVAHLAERFRSFRYSETAIDHRRMRWYGYDIVGVGFEAGICAHSYHLAQGRPMDRWTIGTCLEEGHDAERFVHVEACVAANCHPNPAPAFFLVPPVSKAREIEDLGPELAGLCWTCRRPQPRPGGGWLECGACKTCRLMGSIHRG